MRSVQSESVILTLWLETDLQTSNTKTITKVFVRPRTAALFPGRFMSFKERFIFLISGLSADFLSRAVSLMWGNFSFHLT